MKNFAFSLPTKVYFGKGQIEHLTELADYGKKALLVYGGGSIKRNGIYDRAMDLLTSVGVEVTELGGVEPNPRVTTVNRGAQICKDEGIDMVLAIGGGSTIDSSKAIAAGAKYDGDAWDLVLDNSKVAAALPVFDVLTLAATGSETNGTAVISNLDVPAKLALKSPCVYPTISILDPTYTFTVSRRQTASGSADMMSHTFENYFSFEPGADLQRRFGEGLLRTIIDNAPVALAHPDDYEARANLMWTASHAISGIAGAGLAVGWVCHPMEHELSAYYDVTHGEGLAVLTPVWMEHILSDKTAPYFATYGRNVWGVTAGDDMAAAKEAIAHTREFLFGTLGIPSTLREIGVPDASNFEVMAASAEKRTLGSFVPLDKAAVVSIYEDAL